MFLVNKNSLAQTDISVPTTTTFDLTTAGGIGSIDFTGTGDTLTLTTGSGDISGTLGFSSAGSTNSLTTDTDLTATFTGTANLGLGDTSDILNLGSGGGGVSTFDVSAATVANFGTINLGANTQLVTGDGQNLGAITGSGAIDASAGTDAIQLSIGAAGYSGTIGGGTAPATVTINTSASGSLTGQINATTVASGGSYTLDGADINATLNLTGNNGPITITNAVTASALSLDANSNLTGTGSLTIDGAAVVSIAAGTFAPDLVISNGANNATISGGAFNGSVALNGTATNSISAGTFSDNIAINENTSISGGTFTGGTITVANTKTLTLDGATIADAVNATGATSGGINLASDAEIGILTLGGNQAISGANTLTVNSTGASSLNTTGTSAANLNFTGTGNVTFLGGTYNGTITAGSTGTQSLSGGTFSGAININENATITNGVTASTGLITVASNKTLTLNGANIASKLDTTAAGSGITLANDSTIGDLALGGDATIVKGVGTQLTINTTTGTTLSSTGTSDADLVFAGASTVDISAGQLSGDLTLGASGGQTIDNAQLTGAIAVNQDATIGTNTTSTGAITVGAGATLTLNNVGLSSTVNASTAGSGIAFGGASNIDALTLGNDATITGAVQVDVDSTAASTLNSSGAVAANLNFINSGNVTLSGSCTYSGTVSLGSTGTQAVSAGTFNGNVDFSQDVAVSGGTFNADVTTTGGTTTITGGTFGGQLNVSAGTADFDADITITGGSSLSGTGTINIQTGRTLTSDIAMSGGSLTGVGNITGTFTQTGGTIKPGNSIGTITYTNPTTIGDTEIEVNSNGTSDLIQSTGGAITLSSGSTMTVIQDSTDSGTLISGQTFDVVTGTAALVDNGVSVVSGISGFNVIGAVKSGDNTTFQLTLAASLTGNTANNASMLNYMYGLAASGQNPSTMFAGITTDADPQLAIQKTTGETIVNNQQAMMQANVVMTNILLSKIRPTWCSQCSCDSPCGACSMDQDLNAWMTGYGLGGQIYSDQNAGTASTNISLGGFMIGIDQNFACDQIKLGAYYSFNSISTNVDLLDSSNNVKNHFFGTYLTKQCGPTYWLASIGFGFDDYRSRRQIDIGSGGSALSEMASGNHSGWQSMVYGEIGSTFRNCVFDFQPYLGLQYNYLYQNAFAETGAANAALDIDQLKDNALRTYVGARSTLPFGNCYGCGSLELRTAWIHQLLDQSASMMNARLVTPTNTASYSVLSSDTGRDWAWVGTGVKWQGKLGVVVYADYDLLFNGCEAIHTGSGGLSLSW